jgi:hypothetical protein
MHIQSVNFIMFCCVCLKWKTCFFIYRMKPGLFSFAFFLLCSFILSDKIICCKLDVRIIDLSDRKKISSKTLYRKISLETYVLVKSALRKDCFLEIRCLNYIRCLSINVNQFEMDVVLIDIHSHN